MYVCIFKKITGLLCKGHDLLQVIPNEISLFLRISGYYHGILIVLLFALFI